MACPTPHCTCGLPHSKPLFTAEKCKSLDTLTRLYGPLSETEKIDIEQHKRDILDRISQNEAHAHEVMNLAESNIQTILAERRRLQWQAQELDGILLPIRRLPAEILGEIFLRAVLQDLGPASEVFAFVPRDQIAPWSISQVSRFWRESALGSPELWSYVSLVWRATPKEQLNLNNRLQTQLLRGLPHPIHVTIFAATADGERATERARSLGSLFGNGPPPFAGLFQNQNIIQPTIFGNAPPPLWGAPTHPTFTGFGLFGPTQIGGGFPPTQPPAPGLAFANPAPALHTNSFHFGPVPTGGTTNPLGAASALVGGLNPPPHTNLLFPPLNHGAPPANIFGQPNTTHTLGGHHRPRLSQFHNVRGLHMLMEHSQRWESLDVFTVRKVGLWRELDMVKDSMTALRRLTIRGPDEVRRSSGASHHRAHDDHFKNLFASSSSMTSLNGPAHHFLDTHLSFKQITHATLSGDSQFLLKVTVKLPKLESLDLTIESESQLTSLVKPVTFVDLRQLTLRSTRAPLYVPGNRWIADYLIMPNLENLKVTYPTYDAYAAYALITNSKFSLTTFEMRCHPADEPSFFRWMELFHEHMPTIKRLGIQGKEFGAGMVRILANYPQVLTGLTHLYLDDPSMVEREMVKTVEETRPTLWMRIL